MNESSPHLLTWFLSLLSDPIRLVELTGYVGLVLIVFAETGLLIGFFLPGDSLLIAAGIVAASGALDPKILAIALSIAAIIGDAVGFHIGKALGHTLYKKEDSWFFRKKHLMTAHDFYEKHGGKTIILARFIPIVRTFAPTVAGAAGMHYGRFLLYNTAGGLLWVWSLVWAGYGLGSAFASDINDYIHLVIGIVILISILPLIIKYISMKMKSKQNSV